MPKVYPWSRIAEDIARAKGADFSALGERLFSASPQFNDEKLWSEAEKVQAEAHTQMATELWADILRGAVLPRDSTGKPLRTDPKALPLSGPGSPHLTVPEGNEWLKSRGYLEDWKPDDRAVTPPPLRVEPVSAQQDRKVLEAIREFGFDPLSIPVNRGGKGGLKSKVKKLVTSRYHITEAAFRSIWERLRANGDIKDA